MAAKQKPEYLKFKDDGDIEITLPKPANIGGAKISVLTMREPTVDDQLVVDGMDASPAVKEITVFANLCTVAPEDIRKLPMRSYGRLQTAYGFFTD